MFGSKEILEAVELLSNEKAIGKDVVFSAVEAGLAAARRRLLAEDVEIRVAIDRHTGEQEYFRQWEVMEDESEEIEAPTRQLRLAEARQIDPDAEPGGVVEKPMDGMDLGHIGAYTAKHVINQKVREAERALIRERYQGRIGELLSGVVKRVDRNGVYVDLGGGVEGFVPREHMIPREPIRPQDRVKGLLYEVATETRGPQLKLTRTSPEFLMALFRVEVPEVGQDLIEILGAARDPGARAKIAVRSREPRIDPGRRLRGHARFARAGGHQRDCGRAGGHHPVGREPGAVRGQRDVAGRRRADHGGRGPPPHGHRRFRVHGVPGNRSRRTEHPSGQPPDRLGVERHDPHRDRVEDRRGEPAAHRNVPGATVCGRRRRPGAGGRGNHRP